MTSYFIGVDVGTGSARAGVFDSGGRKWGEGHRDIALFKPQADYVEQSSNDIWQAVCHAVREAVSRSGVQSGQIKGMGFDATCSLVVLDPQGQPVTVSPTGNPEQNIMVWMDHRAMEQAELINATHHPVLKFVGGVISVEMQTPKLLWLKQHLPDSYRRAGYFFDLPDFLTWRATGDSTRSLCSTVCKWTYLGHEKRWDRDYFVQIGLEELLADGAFKIGQQIKSPGQPMGRGLTGQAAQELGLAPGTAVSASIIDGHAGALGTLGAANASGEPVDYNRRVSLIGGTSSCHIAISEQPRFVEGVWGPYFGALLPEMWLTEGGQSATGALVDHIIQSHPAWVTVQAEAKARQQTVYRVLNELLLQMAGDPTQVALLTHQIHVNPDFHGNRSPLADPTRTGAITGLTLSGTVNDLALHYLAAIQAIALGTRHIIETLNQRGYRIDTLMLSGGGGKNPLFIQEHANATGCTLILGEESEAMLLGAAMMATVAAESYDTLAQAMAAMSRAGKICTPQDRAITRYYDHKFTVYRELQRDADKYRQIMAR